MKKISIILFLCLMFNTATAAKVTEYRPFFARVNANEITLRQIDYSNHTTRYLVLNTHDFSTRITRHLPISAIEVSSVESLADSSAYFTIRKQIEHNPTRYASGIDRFERVQGVVITGDLCPSSKAGIEQTFIDSLAKHKHATLYVCISGRWIDHHQEEFKQLRREPIKLVWVNHSLTHRYEKREQANEDFLCLPNTDLHAEVLGMERKMFESGLTPSPFFRYPGLISSPEVVSYVIGLGLIPLGAEAWLAKGQEPRQGSVVLVHLNLNEPHGIRLFFKNKNTYPILPIQ